MKRDGYSLVELVFALAIFSMLILVVVGLENQMLRLDRSMRLKFMVHPDDMAVMARLRRDVLDAQGYPTSRGSYRQSPTTLILSGLTEGAAIEEVVYDFGTKGHARRMTFSGNQKTGEWIGRGLPKFRISSFEMPDQAGVAVRLRGYDSKDQLIVDQILFPRREN